MSLVQFSFALCMICAVLFVDTKAETFSVRNSERPGHPGFCYFEDVYSPKPSRISFYLKPGVSLKHPKNCFQIDCSETFELNVVGCGIAQETEKCSFVEGVRNDPYPECCGKIHCIED